MNWVLKDEQKFARMDRTIRRWRRGMWEDRNGGWGGLCSLSINQPSSRSSPGQLTYRELLRVFLSFFCFKSTPLSHLKANIWLQHTTS